MILIKAKRFERTSAKLCKGCYTRERLRPNKRYKEYYNCEICGSMTKDTHPAYFIEKKELGLSSIEKILKTWL